MNIGSWQARLLRYFKLPWARLLKYECGVYIFKKYYTISPSLYSEFPLTERHANGRRTSITCFVKLNILRWAECSEGLKA